MRTGYDFIFSIGSACSCTEVLRAAGLQYASFPFDWITVRDRPNDIRHKADAICAGFQDWFNREDFEYAGTKPWHLKDFYRNRRTSIVYHHDFPKGVPFETAYPTVRARYDRRISRLFRCIRSSKTVLLVRIDRPDQEYPATVEDCAYLRSRLSEKFPDVRFDLLFLSCELGRSCENRLETAVTDGFTHLVFDYKSRAPEAQPYTPDMPLLVEFFRSRFAVRDYRTAAEKKADRRRKRLARYRQFGANDFLHYRLNRLKLSLEEGRLHRQIAHAGRRQKTFGRLVPLGLDPEAAARLQTCNGRTPPSLLGRATLRDLGHLEELIRDPESLFSGDVTLDETTKAWRCTRTGVLIDGHLKWGKPGTPPPTDPALDADKAQTILEIARQKKDFAALRSAPERILFVLFLRPDDLGAPDLASRLDALQQTLGGALLVICGSGLPANVRETERLFVRTLPPHSPHNAELAWRTVFTEFHA